MIARLRLRMTDDDGFTLVEMGVALFLGALISTLMLSWVFAVAAADDLHRTDDEIMQGLRFTEDEISRDLRSGVVTAISDTSVAVWRDLDHDGQVGADESIVWTIAESGELLRSVDGASPKLMIVGVDPLASGFSFDAATPSEVGSVGVELVVTVDAERGPDGTRTLSIEISVRGAS